MDPENAVERMAALLKRLRSERGISQLQLADFAGVNQSVVNRAERGMDAKLSTWDKLFESLGWRLLLDATESSEDAEGLHREEASERRERRREGLIRSRGWRCAGGARTFAAPPRSRARAGRTALGSEP